MEARVSHLPRTPACIDYTMWKAALWANEPFYSVKYDRGLKETESTRMFLTSLPRLNSLNHEPGFSLGQEVILA